MNVVSKCTSILVHREGTCYLLHITAKNQDKYEEQPRQRMHHKDNDTGLLCQNPRKQLAHRGF